MKRISKRDVILEAIIREYLKFGEPIGSSELQTRINLDMSPSTIRIYLKQLSQEGALVQLHVSSGRVPTQNALVEYWREKIDPSKTLALRSIQILEDCVQEYGLYCILEKNSRDTLKEIIEVSNRFLVLVFEKNEVILKHSDQVKRFLSNLIGCGMHELKNISAQVGLYELYDKLHQIFAHSHLLRSGENQLYAIAREYSDDSFIAPLLSTHFSLTLTEGVYFDGFVPSGCMAVKHLVSIEDEDADLFCFGKIDCDFEGFFINSSIQRK